MNLSLFRPPFLSWTLLVGLLAPAAPLSAQYIVNSTGDGADVTVIDGVCLTVTGTCTLRAAIQQVNEAGVGTISFLIPGAGPHTIAPTSALPTIRAIVTIDGYTQPGALPNTTLADPGPGLPTANNAVLQIELTSGLAIEDTIACVIRGLVINGPSANKILLRFGGGHRIEGNFIGTDPTGMADASPTGNGIRIVDSAFNVIGGMLPAQRNVIAGNSTNVLAGFSGLAASPGRLTIQGNLIGTNAAGDAAFNNGPGIAVSGGTAAASRPADEHVIGGSDADDGAADGLVQARNVISGHTIGIHNTDSVSTRISGNYIGTDVTGEIPLGSPTTGVGIHIDGVSTGTFVGGWAGGLAPGAANVICCSNIGLLVAGNGPAGTIVRGNRIGLSPSGGFLGVGTTGVDLNAVSGVLLGGPIPEDANVIACAGIDGSACPGAGINARGIRVTNSTASTILGNTITLNAGRGIHVSNSSQIRITRNSVFANNAIGLDLQSAGQLSSFVTPNDGLDLDVDTGANGLQNFPELTTASGTLSGPGTTVEGILHSTPSATFWLEFFASTMVNRDPSGYGEGQVSLGPPVPVTRAASGEAPFSLVLAPALPVLSGVITATATDALNNTSEFSASIEVTILNSAPVASSGPDRTLTEGDAVVLDGSNSSDVDGDPLTYTWRQIGVPPAINPTGLDTATPAFTAPQVVGAASLTLTFELVVNDGTVDSALDQVVVTVLNDNHPPIANAGPDQVVDGGTVVVLNGTGTDLDGDPLTFAWTQPPGQGIGPLAATATPSFTAPFVAGGVTLRFTLKVNDGFVDSLPDEVVVTVRPDLRPPDLIVAQLSATGPAGPGGPVDVTDRTRNIGLGAVSPSFTRFYLSRTPDLSAVVVVLGERIVGNLPPSGEHETTTRVTMPAGVALGNYFLVAEADAMPLRGEGHEESDETNNIRSTPLRVTLPDLQFSLFSMLTFEGPVTSDRPAVALYTIVNRGGSAGRSTTQFTLSAVRGLPVEFPLHDEALEPMLAGEVRSLRTTMYMPFRRPSLDGREQLTAIIDGTGVVVESDESNNTARLVFSFKFPNLQAESLTASPVRELVPGVSSITVRLEVRNDLRGVTGQLLATDRITAVEYLLQRIDGRGIVQGPPVPLGGGSVPPLRAVESYTDARALPIPANIAPGRYVLVARVDAAGEVVELDEADNVANVDSLNTLWTRLCESLAGPALCARQFRDELTIGLPDLRVTNVEFPEGVAVWEFAVRVHVNFENNSPVPTTHAAQIVMWFSRDAVIGDPGDIAIPIRSFGALDPHQDGEVERAVSLADIPEGQWRVLVQIDPDEEVREADESNNVYFVATVDVEQH